MNVTITTKNGSRIEFLGLDEPGEIRGHSTMSAPFVIDRNGKATPIDLEPGSIWVSPNKGDRIVWQTIHMVDGEVVK